MLKKETKSREQEKEELEEQIKKKQAALDKMIKNKPVLSSRQAREVSLDKKLIVLN